MNESLYPFSIYIPLILIFYIDRRLSVESGIAISLFIGISLILIAHLKTKTYFHEVRLKDNRLILIGDNTNRPLEVDLPVSETVIQIKSKGGGRGSVNYYLRFINQGKKYEINRLFNWDYGDLISLFHEFKRQKNEKVIWDEKYLLEHMEKKIKR